MTRWFQLTTEEQNKLQEYDEILERLKAKRPESGKNAMLERQITMLHDSFTAFICELDTKYDSCVELSRTKLRLIPGGK